MRIGPYVLKNNLILAPMAGVSDRPFRQVCRELGASMAVSEMVSSNPRLRHNKRTLLKSNHSGELQPRTVQILGADPKQMAEAAHYNATRGAQIIDINMGCPAKKVCNTAAGSALLRNELLVEQILAAVVSAVDIPVTLKIRTGWDKQNRNALNIAQIAEKSGVSALTVHGRTRACGFSGEAEFETIRAVKQSVGIPVIANGDIDTPEKAKLVLQFTGADAIMVGRGAQGRPWLFRDIEYYFTNNILPEPITSNELLQIMLCHLNRLYDFYGAETGVRFARKHIGWYLRKNRVVASCLIQSINQAENPKQQVQRLKAVFERPDNNLAA